MVTKEIFQKYVKVQLDGNYNMVIDGIAISRMIGCSWADYTDILRNYTKYMVEFNIK